MITTDDLARPACIPFYVDRLIELNCCGTCEKCRVRKTCKDVIKSIRATKTQQQSRKEGS